MSASRATPLVALCALLAGPAAADSPPDSAELMQRIGCVEMVRTILEGGFAEAGRIERGGWGPLRQVLWDANERLAGFEETMLRPWIDAEGQAALAADSLPTEFSLSWEPIDIPEVSLPEELALLGITLPKGPEADMRYSLSPAEAPNCYGLFPPNPLLDGPLPAPEPAVVAPEQKAPIVVVPWETMPFSQGTSD